MAEHSSTPGAGRGSTLAAEEEVLGPALVAAAAGLDSLLVAAALRPAPCSAADMCSLVVPGLRALPAEAYLASRPARACLALVGSRA